MPIQKTYRIETDATSLRIILSPGTPLSRSLGRGLYIFINIALAIAMLRLLQNVYLNDIEILRKLIGCGVLLIMVGLLSLFLRAIIRRTSEVEVLTVDALQIIISLQSAFGKKDKVFRLADVKQIGVAEEENFTAHPLEGTQATINFTVNERLIRYQITDGDMFISDGKTKVRFGKSIPSWDAEEIVQKIEQYTGRTFMIKKPEEEEYWK